jgi:hypothetical protein
LIACLQGIFHCSAICDFFTFQEVKFNTLSLSWPYLPLPFLVVTLSSSSSRKISTFGRVQHNSVTIWVKGKVDQLSTKMEGQWYCRWFDSSCYPLCWRYWLHIHAKTKTYSFSSFDLQQTSTEAPMEACKTAGGNEQNRSLKGSLVFSTLTDVFELKVK